ncbi:MAG: hypothetical protein KME20_14850 [Kaiparowitsia implicata GSE-PSE-MK54-09C]|jgi:hypothetical protein|nr:hypothetical protein [Kaiparowitsia implicata GSE-PSE-MK54-09C]
MATSTVLEFMRQTAENEALRQQLEALLGVGDGNISSESELDAEESAALSGDRAPIVAEFAAQQGFQFSAEDLIIVVDAFQKLQAGALSDAEFAAMMGAPVGQVTTPKTRSSANRITRFLKKTYLGLDS